MSNWMWHPYFLNILDVDVVLNILDVMGVDVDVDGHTQHSIIFGFEILDIRVPPFEQKGKKF